MGALDGVSKQSVRSGDPGNATMRWMACLLTLVLAVCTARPQDGDGENDCYGDDCNESECYGEDCFTTLPTTTDAPTTTDGDDELVEDHHHVKRQAEDVVAFSPEQRGQVAFTVTKGVQTSRRPGLRFQTVLTNVGGAWNTRTSRFEAPYTGGYFFTYHAVSAINEDFTLALMRNGRYQVTAYGSNDGYQHASNSAFLKLNRGDIMHLELQEGHIYEHPRDESYISFTGFMLYMNVH
ncbi:hypothetical protein O3P69_005969 [Scylla paramamosain]|uniref:C1q domain-containing protein n=1 Tax=Scylla paramamosain TaxID=85552 RepID=A0AAW0U924_SCYPA